ncbi:glycoside hydrolase family 19 protein [Actinoplanes sp. NPDC051494]|uniref:glycoside hydrolase family 19 protein n=1 Tax=Actinoplanes sp. NPDC051494 TaxID=3363907 RepID=UPI0037A2158B
MASANKLRRAAEQAGKPPDATQIAWITVSVIGFIPLLAIVLVCLLGIVILTGSTSVSSNPMGTASGLPELLGEGVGDVPSGLLGGNGQGQLAADAVPIAALVPVLQEAGRECELISPAVLAAQIQVESQFDRDVVGPAGELGISQLPAGVFEEYGQDDDDNGSTAVLDDADSIHAQARYLCALGVQVGELIANHEVAADQLSLTLLVWDVGIDNVKALGLLPVPVQSYPYEVRTLFAAFLTGETTPPTTRPTTTAPATGTASPGPAPTGPAGPPGSTGFNQAMFARIFPHPLPIYTYAGLTQAMAKYPAFAAGSGDNAKREIAAFLANVNQESGGLRYIEELNQSLWGDYCDRSQSYGCPAGQRAYHGRGPLQLSWNYNYKAAGDSLGRPLLTQPGLVMTDPMVAWGSAMWFWMTQSGAGPIPAHAAINGSAGFAGTIRSINGAIECGKGGNTPAINNRVNSYTQYCALLGVSPGGPLRC